MKKNLKILYMLIVLFVAYIVIPQKSNAINTQWTDFENAVIKLVEKDEEESENLKYDLKFENVTFNTDEGTKYYVFISNSSTKPEFGDTDTAMENNATEVWTTSSEKIVSYEKMNSFIDKNGNIYVWIVESKTNSNEHKEVLTAREVAKPTMSKVGERIVTTFSSNFRGRHTTISIREPYDSTVERTLTINIGKVTDFEILSAIKEEKEGALEKLINYAENTQPIYTKTAKVGTSLNIIDDLELENNEYYYIYNIVDNNGNQYRTLKDVNLYQYTGKQQTAYYDTIDTTLLGYNSPNFSWDNIEKYAPSKDTNKGSDSGAEDDANKGSNKGSSDKKDNTTAQTGKLPFAGEYSIIISLIIVIFAIGLIYFIKLKKMKDVK